MLSLKALPPMTNFLSLLTLLVISTTALAGNPPFPFNDEALRFDLMSHEKAMHGSTFDYFLVETGEGNRLWGNRSGNWNLVISEPRDLYGIWGFDGQNIFIAHGSHHGVYTNRTGSWTEETFPGSPCNVYDVWGFESNDVFAVGGYYQEG